MQDSFESIIKLVLFILPAYFANSTPVLFGGGKHLDLGIMFIDGRRLFGDGKTIRGFFSGILAGGIVGGLLGIILPFTSLYLLRNFWEYLLAGFALGTGAMCGDALGSFIKRRLAIPSGQPSFLLDQLTFLIVAIVFAYPFADGLYSVPSLLFLFILTYFLHVGFNILANKIGLKKVPW